MPLAFPAEHVLGYAYQQIGKPYVFATAGPSSFDCSGLALAAWKPFVTLPHNTDQQVAVCKPLRANGLSLEIGDLFFYHTDPSNPHSFSHVAIFVGYSSNGTPLVIQATDEQRGVEILSVTQYAIPSWTGRPSYAGWNHRPVIYG